MGWEVCYFYPKNKTTLPLIVEGTSMPLAQRHLETIGSAQVKSSRKGLERDLRQGEKVLRSISLLAEALYTGS